MVKLNIGALPSLSFCVFPFALATQSKHERFMFIQLSTLYVDEQVFARMHDWVPCLRLRVGPKAGGRVWCGQAADFERA